MPPFTIDQIKTAHLKVKSGADFPNYIQEIKTLGVIAYEHFVSNGQVTYYGNSNYTTSADPKWEKREITETGDAEQLQAILKIHQAGKTDYLTFCKESAEAGVEKWIVDLSKMTCGYYDLEGNEMLVEFIPK